MTDGLRARLVALADRYETADFLRDDPSKFMHAYEDARDRETAAFIAANLAFGRRDQILSHVERILAEAGGSPAEWVERGGWRGFFPDDGRSFYRTYSNRSMRLFFATLGRILAEGGSPGDFFRRKWESRGGGFLHEVVAEEFPAECTLVPHAKGSAAKKLNMMLRWLVRRDSPVDIGLWTWFGAESLLVPLDTHVMQEATRLGLLPAGANGRPRAASLRAALSLTEEMRQAFPNDPARGDFALFGLGVDASSGENAP